MHQFSQIAKSERCVLHLQTNSQPDKSSVPPEDNSYALLQTPKKLFFRLERHHAGAGDPTMTEDQREDLLTVREVARQLRVDDTTVRRWIKSGALEAITLPHRGKRQAYRIKQSTLDALLNAPLPD